ncbi:hypothetical protein [Listeria booriae]|uniref:hypothetical protein n=1 Tax=Listeria booriae TaxID=1552123 RepID=UPI001627C5BE|nr:hypothetical protein [Listeria booriae]MBC1801133.1 hypothetical protein [Listeria booriae]
MKTTPNRRIFYGKKEGDGMKARIYKNALGLILGGQTLLFGLFLLFHKNFMETKGAYATFTNVMDDGHATAILLAVGILYILCVLFDWNKLRRWAIVGMSFIWLVFFAAFLLRELGGYPNSGWIFTLGLNLAIIYEAVKEDFE